MSIDQFFHEHPVFRIEEFDAWKGALRYYLKTKRLVQIRRGLYAVVPPNQTPETLTVDPYLIAAKSAGDSVLAYHTALELHGVAYSAFGQLTYVTSQKNKIFEFHGGWFQAVTSPLALGVQIINRQGLNIQVTSLARTFVDVLDRIELSGGWEEVCRSISNMAVLNIDEVIQYCLALDNARLVAKVGYFLEQRSGAFAVSKNQLKLLLDAKPKTPQYVSKRGNEKFQLVKKWNILMPVPVINQAWEEPHVYL